MNNDQLNTSLLSNESFINQPYIITFFRSWSGGKLINHCLELSSQVWFGDLNTAIIESNLTDKKLYDFKLQSCLKTIPKNKDINHELWWDLEKGEIYGDSIMDLILKQKKYIPSVCHGVEQKFQKFFTIKKQSISAIELVNTDAFQPLSWNLKKVPEKLRISTKFIIPFKPFGLTSSFCPKLNVNNNQTNTAFTNEIKKQQIELETANKKALLNEDI